MGSCVLWMFKHYATRWLLILVFLLVSLSLRAYVKATWTDGLSGFERVGGCRYAPYKHIYVCSIFHVAHECVWAVFILIVVCWIHFYKILVFNKFGLSEAKFINTIVGLLSLLLAPVGQRRLLHVPHPIFLSFFYYLFINSSHGDSIFGAYHEVCSNKLSKSWL